MNNGDLLLLALPVELRRQTGFKASEAVLGGIVGIDIAAEVASNSVKRSLAVDSEALVFDWCVPRVAGLVLGNSLDGDLDGAAKSNRSSVALLEGSTAGGLGNAQFQCSVRVCAHCCCWFAVVPSVGCCEKL